MCVNCLTNSEAALAGAAFVGYAVKPAVHRGLARIGLANEPDIRRLDSETVAFLRSLDLDPVDVLGADVVAAAATWVTPDQPVPALAAWRRWRDSTRRASARPIGSQSLITAR